MNFAQRSTRTVLTFVLVLAVFLFGGTGITAYAASSALPGDALYPVKTSMESARISLTGDDAAQARLYLDFAGRRLAEIQTLIQEGRTSFVAKTSDQFKDNVEKAMDAIERLSKTDSTRPL